MRVCACLKRESTFARALLLPQPHTGRASPLSRSSENLGRPRQLRSTPHGQQNRPSPKQPHLAMVMISAPSSFQAAQGRASPTAQISRLAPSMLQRLLCCEIVATRGGLSTTKNSPDWSARQATTAPTSSPHNMPPTPLAHQPFQLNPHTRPRTDPHSSIAHSSIATRHSPRSPPTLTLVSSGKGADLPSRSAIGAHRSSKDDM